MVCGRDVAVDAAHVNRRRFLAGAAGLTGAGLALAACGGSGKKNASSNGAVTGSSASSESIASATASGSGSSGAAGLLPAYTPYTGVTASGPSTSDLVVPYFDSYPANPVQFSSKPPLSSAVQIFTNTNVGTPTPMGQNAFWQELNKRAGATVNYTMVPNEQYLAKLQTAIAGGNLGEIVSMRAVANMPELMQKDFTDLSPWLSGDNVKKYPGLANIPTISWRSSVYGGGLYTIPIPRMPAAPQMTICTSAIEKAGADPNITSYADFVKVCKAITDPGKHQWAMAGPPTILTFVQEMTGAANVWQVDNGKFTYYGEQDNFTQALSAVASMWKQGLFHPDSFASPGSATSWLNGGIIWMYNGSEDWATTWEGPAGSTWNCIVAPKYDGGGAGAQYYSTAQYGSGMALRKNNASRIEELLGFMNWLAAPFGTEEYFFFVNGVEGVDYTLKDGNPVQTDRGSSELTLPVRYTAAPAYALYQPGYNDVMKQVYDFELAAAKVAVLPPTLGLYSATDASKGATLSTNLTNLIASVIQGRKSLKDWSSAMRTWQSSGGNTIRGEYEKAYAAANGSS